VINVQDFSLRIGPRELVNHASFRIDKGMCIGLVGRNGAGKTTTMRLLAGEGDRGGAAEYTGTISSNGTVGYLAQDTHVGDPSMKARDRIISVRGIDSIIARIRKAEHEMSTTEGARQQRAMERYVKLDQQFTNSGGWAANAEAAQIAHSLGLEDRVLDQTLDTLSGGQRRRVELARVLFSDADVLLLDEPTNHLDHDSIVWLRDWIKTFPGGVMIISHDVKLLGDTVNQVFYLDANRAQIDIYHLGWSAYLKQREEDERRRRKERANALKKAEHLKAQGEKMRAKATKAVAAQQMLRRAEELFAQAGSSWLLAAMPVQRTWSAILGSDTSGLPEPSRKPKRLRAAMAPGSALGSQPSMLQRMTAVWAVFLMMSRRAAWQVSGENAQICRLRSPSHQDFWSLSLGKSRISCRCFGFLSLRPKRSSKRLLPTPAGVR